MTFYEEYCLPHLINCACGTPEVDQQRAKMVPHAKGKVLEVGMGSGLNLRHYDVQQVEMVWGLEPSEGMRRKARKNIGATSIPVEWLSLPSESIPLQDHCADSVVLTYTLCTIPDWLCALKEMRRVLKPGGQLIFSEHGLAPDASVRVWQNRINPIWKKLAGGCNLNRSIPELINSSGFKITQLEQGYLKGPKVATYQYYGLAI